jgi:transcription initiation factor TFIIIB Brf1 subunit/transcription initiation factor TFIIB
LGTALGKRLSTGEVAEYMGFDEDTVRKYYTELGPLGAIQAILRHKSAGTTERYLKSLGLEETRVHLEAVCDMRKPVEEANEASGKKPAEVINIKDRLEKRSQAA